MAADEELHRVCEEHGEGQEEAADADHDVVGGEVVEHVGLGIHLELGIAGDGESEAHAGGEEDGSVAHDVVPLGGGVLEGGVHQEG